MIVFYSALTFISTRCCKIIITWSEKDILEISYNIEFIQIYGITIRNKLIILFGNSNLVLPYRYHILLNVSIEVKAGRPKYLKKLLGF